MLSHPLSLEGTCSYKGEFILSTRLYRLDLFCYLTLTATNEIKHQSSNFEIQRSSGAYYLASLKAASHSLVR